MIRQKSNQVLVAGTMAMLWLFVSCNNSPSTVATPKRTNTPISIQVPEEKNDIFADSLYSDARHIILKEFDGLIGGVDKVLVQDNRIFILDRYKAKSIFAFNHQGEYEFRIGKKGGGPGEFTSLEDFDISDGQIVTYDSGNGRINLFDLQGNFIDEGPRLPSIGVIPDIVLSHSNLFITYTQASCADFGCYGLVVSDSDNNIQYKDISNSHLYEFNVDFGKSAFRHQRDVFVTQLFNDTIYHLGADLEMSTPYVLDFGKSKPNDEQLMKLIEDTSTGLGKLMAGNYNLGTVKLFANGTQIWLQYLRNRSLANVVINRKDNSIKAFNQVMFDPTRQFNFNSPVGVTDNEWIFHTGNESLSTYEEHIEELSSEKQQILKKINPNTNGVLTFAQIK